MADPPVPHRAAGRHPDATPVGLLEHRPEVWAGGDQPDLLVVAPEVQDKRVPREVAGHEQGREDGGDKNRETRDQPRRPAGEALLPSHDVETLRYEPRHEGTRGWKEQVFENDEGQPVSDGSLRFGSECVDQDAGSTSDQPGGPVGILLGCLRPPVLTSPTAARTV